MREPYNATRIEHSLSVFFGTPVAAPGRPWDAVIFRQGDTRRIAAVLDLVADQLDQRVSRVEWTEADRKPGGAHGVLVVSAARLRGHADALRHSGIATPDDPEWELLSILLDVTDGLLRKLGV